MALVLDCSVTMAWLFPDEPAEATDRPRDSLAAARVWGAVLELANRHGLSVYGAMYLERAVRMRLPHLPRWTGRSPPPGQAAGVDVPKPA